MNSLKDRVAEKTWLVSDGAWGTQLQARGLRPGECPEAWNVERPDDVRAVAAAYVDAGADLVLANTFGGNELKLAKFGLPPGMVALFNAAGAALSREAAGGAALVAASMGPTSEFAEPYGDMAVEDMEGMFARQAAALSEGGARIVCIETMSALEEACAAVRGARRADPGLEIIATMTFDPGPKGCRTMMGVSPADAARALEAEGADAVGANCGHGMAQMVDIVREMRAATALPLIVHANAGVPELVDGRTVFRETPEAMAARVDALLDAGATIVGGCCGTTPAHIAALRAAVDARRARRA